MPSCVAGLLRDIGKGAVAVIVVELVLAIVGKKQIFEPVVVVVAYANADSPAGIPQSSFLGDVFECTVAIVLV